MIIVVDEFMRLKKENEQLKSENIRFQSIIDNAGLYLFDTLLLINDLLLKATQLL